MGRDNDAEPTTDAPGSVPDVESSADPASVNVPVDESGVALSPAQSTPTVVSLPAGGSLSEEQELTATAITPNESPSGSKDVSQQRIGENSVVSAEPLAASEILELAADLIDKKSSARSFTAHAGGSNLQQANVINILNAPVPTLPTVAPQTFADSLRALPGTFISGVLDFVASALAPLIGPGAPFANTSLWDALVLLRRQFDQAYANHTPTLIPAQTHQDLDDGQVHGTFGAADFDGDTLTYTVPATGAGAPAHGTVTIDSSTGTWTYTPDNNGTPADYSDDYSGPDSFAVIVSDASAGSHIHALGATHAAVALVAVQVNPVNVDPTNHSPVPPATPPAKTVDHSDGTVVSTIGWTDPDGDILRYANPTDPTATTWTTTTALGGTVTATSTGAYSYTPEPADRLNAYTHPDQSNDTFSVVVTDGRGSTQTITVAVSIDPIESIITSTVSAPLPADALGDFRFVGTDGTVALIKSTYVGGATNPYRTTVTVLRPGASVPISVTIDGTIADESSDTARVGADGTVAVTTFTGSGGTADPYKSTVTVLRPGTSTPLTTTVIGQSTGPASVSANGTVTFITYTRTGADLYQVTVTELRPGTSTPTMTTVNAESVGASQVGADGTVALITAATGSGSAEDPDQTTVVVLRPGNSPTTATLTGHPYESNDAYPAVQVGADGTVTVITYTETGGPVDSYLFTVTRLRSGAGLPEVIAVTGTWGDQLQVGADGTVALTHSTGSGSVADPYRTTVTVVRPGASTPATATVTGESVGVAQVGADGTVALTTSVNSGISGGPPQVTVTVFRPGAGAPVSATTVGSPSLGFGFPIGGSFWLGPAQVGADGTVALTTYSSSGSSAGSYQSTVTVLRPGASASEITTVPGIAWGAAQVRADGTVALLAVTGSGSAADPTRSTVTVLRPGASTPITASPPGLPIWTVQLGADGAIVVNTSTAEIDPYAFFTLSVITVAEPPPTVA